MKKLIFAIAIVLGSLISTSTYAQKADKIDPVAAISKGIVTNPTPGILAFIAADNYLQSVYNSVKGDVTWYMYKGLIYASYNVNLANNPLNLPPGNLIVVFTTKGEPLDAFFTPFP